MLRLCQETMEECGRAHGIPEGFLRGAIIAVGCAASKVTLPASVGPNHVGGLLRDHQHAGVDVRCDKIGHRRRIDHAQAVDAAYLAARGRAPCVVRLPIEQLPAGWCTVSVTSADVGVNVGVRLSCPVPARAPRRGIRPSASASRSRGRACRPSRNVGMSFGAE